MNLTFGVDFGFHSGICLIRLFSIDFFANIGVEETVPDLLTTGSTYLVPCPVFPTFFK
jgi:hypothetical protein